MDNLDVEHRWITCRTLDTCIITCETCGGQYSRFIYQIEILLIHWEVISRLTGLVHDYNARQFITYLLVNGDINLY